MILEYPDGSERLVFPCTDQFNPPADARVTYLVARSGAQWHEYARVT